MRIDLRIFLYVRMNAYMFLWKNFFSWFINAFLVKDAEEFELWNDATVKIGIIEKNLMVEV